MIEKEIKYYNEAYLRTGSRKRVRVIEQAMEILVNDLSLSKEQAIALAMRNNVPRTQVFGYVHTRDD